MPTIFLQITMLVSVNRQRLYRNIYFFKLLRYDKQKGVVEMKKKFSKIKMTGILLGSIASLLLNSCSMLPKKNLHGEKLLKLSDDQLFEAVYFYNLDLVESYPDEVNALSQISPERRVAYILSIFDMELQNGGLCQFFVNSSRSLAPYVDECLKTVGAEEHRKLFAAFVSNNQIDLSNLDSFRISDIEDYTAQTERYDFDAFDNSFFELSPLQDFIVAYIKANISKF